MFSHISITTIFFFFFNDTATTEIYTLSLHDALPISPSTRWPPTAACLKTPEPASWRSRASPASMPADTTQRSEEHTSELQSQSNLVCRLLLEKKKNKKKKTYIKKNKISKSTIY